MDLYRICVSEESAAAADSKSMRVMSDRYCN